MSELYVLCLFLALLLSNCISKRNIQIDQDSFLVNYKNQSKISIIMFRTQFNNHKSKGEINSGEENTIPNQSLSVREILNRYIKGLPIDNIQRKGYYTGSDDFEDYDETLDPNFDLSDVTEGMLQIERNKQEREIQSKAAHDEITRKSEATPK